MKKAVGVWFPNPILAFGLETRVWRPGFGDQGLETRVWRPGFGENPYDKILQPTYEL
ncbi:hypothetical protein [Hydrocoleum sp. CS-953]|uniref:hypothetical protein n=1 Tax=Hydrocoleum sp. CS-953 TaxID=1671698 RepID=UPI00143CDD2C|nr:hypothetical protein [Hydrocoleum sp. CS-953]